MKIGVIGPIWLSIPPRAYGGTEDVVYNLVNELVSRGHDVTLFGPKGSQVKAKVHATIPWALRDQGIDWRNVGFPLLHITEAFDRTEEFDLLHMHINKSQDDISFPLAQRSKTPVVFTLHFQLPPPSKTDSRYHVLKKYRGFPFISISNSQRKRIDLNYVANVYNGINLIKFPFSERRGTYLAWIGKVTPWKGTKEAILAAKKAGIKIFVMGTIDESVPEVLSYYENEVKPLLDDKQAVWLGEVSHNEKTSILSGARAFLNPIQWEEPFGLVMVESLAVGTPVISYKRGSSSELIVDGKTGYLVNNLEQMVEKIHEVEMLDRTACRKSVEERFTIEKMVEGYEHAYRNVIDNWNNYNDKHQRDRPEKNKKSKLK